MYWNHKLSFGWKLNLDISVTWKNNNNKNDSDPTNSNLTGLIQLTCPASSCRRSGSPNAAHVRKPKPSKTRPERGFR